MKDIYVKFDSPAIKGESQDKDHKDWIEVSSWLQSITQPRSATASTAGGHTAERCEHADMVFTKDMDVVSPLLYQHASGGTTFGEVTIEFFRADGEGNRVKYQEVKLKPWTRASPTTPSRCAMPRCSGSTRSRRARAARAVTRKAPGASPRTIRRTRSNEAV